MPSILNWISNRVQRRRNAHEFYGSIVAAARNPTLYSELGVPDTLEGRFEMLVVHMYLTLERLDGQDRDARRLKQDLVDRFFADMDTTTRQAGVGDMAVPKKMRGLAQAFAARMQSYQEAFAARDADKLDAELKTLVFAETPGSKSRAKRLGRHLNRVRTRLNDMTMEDLQAGSLEQMIAGKGETA